MLIRSQVREIWLILLLCAICLSNLKDQISNIFQFAEGVTLFIDYNIFPVITGNSMQTICIAENIADQYLILALG